MRTRIKICGMTRLEDALVAAHAGVDALGFIFYAKSPRGVSIEQAQLIMRQLPPLLNRVALFVDADKAWVEQVIKETQIDTLQFHGSEDEAFCRQFSKPYYKTLHIREGMSNLEQQLVAYPSAHGFLFDSYHPQKMGGTGHTFDWSSVMHFKKAAKQKALMMAGGLTADNVYQAILQLNPYAVDVASGVEFEPGKKSAQKIKDFVQQVRLADQDCGGEPV